MCETVWKILKNKKIHAHSTRLQYIWYTIQSVSTLGSELLPCFGMAGKLKRLQKPSAFALKASPHLLATHESVRHSHMHHTSAAGLDLYSNRLSKFKQVYCCLIPSATLSRPLLCTTPPLSHSGPEKWVPPNSMVWHCCHHRKRMGNCLIISHVSDSCGRKAAMGDKCLPALSSSHQVGPHQLSCYRANTVLLPVQLLVYLAHVLLSTSLSQGWPV